MWRAVGLIFCWECRYNYQPRSLAKQGESALGSVRLTVCVCVCLYESQLSAVKGVFLCVCNQGAYPDNSAVAVDQPLVWFCFSGARSCLQEDDGARSCPQEDGRGSQLSAGGLRGSQLSAGLRGSQLSAGLRGSQLSAGGLRGSQLSAGLRGSQLSAGGLRGSQLSAGLSGSQLSAGGLRGSQLSAEGWRGSQLSTGSECFVGGGRCLQLTVGGGRWVIIKIWDTFHSKVPVEEACHWHVEWLSTQL